MIRGLYNRWSQLHIGWKSAAALAMGINALSFTETFMATRNTLPSHGLAFPFEAYENVSMARFLLIPNGIGNGAMRGVVNHTKLWLLEPDYCNAPSPALGFFVNLHTVAGDNGVIAALPIYGAVGTPGAVLGGMLAGTSVAAQELMTGGEFFHLHRCAGLLAYKSPKVFKRPSHRP